MMSGNKQRRRRRLKWLYTVAMYNQDGVVMRYDDTVAVSPQKAINNVRYRWRGVQGVHYMISAAVGVNGEIVA